MAAGSQLEKGNCALLVILVNKSNTVSKCDSKNWAKCIASNTRRKQSPTRLVKAVMTPLPRDLRFLK